MRCTKALQPVRHTAPALDLGIGREPSTASPRPIPMSMPVLCPSRVAVPMYSAFDIPTRNGFSLWYQEPTCVETYVFLQYKSLLTPEPLHYPECAS